MRVRAALPDLDTLNHEALKAVILAQHRTLAAQEEELHSKDDSRASRQAEIERLKLLNAKLRRMQFGRKSEKLERQIEQLELRLDELETAQAAKANASPAPGAAARTADNGRPVRQPLPAHLPREVRKILPKETACPDCGGEVKPLGEDVSEILEWVPASFKVIRPVRPKLACALRQNRAGGSASPSDRARHGGTGTAGACAGVEVLRPSSLVPAGRDLCARRRRAGPRDAGGERAAALYSLIGTAKLNGRDPESRTADRDPGGLRYGCAARATCSHASPTIPSTTLRSCCRGTSPEAPSPPDSQQHRREGRSETLRLCGLALASHRRTD